MKYTSILAMAQHHHGEAADQNLPQASSLEELSALGEDRHLSRMAQCVFQAGFSWKVVAQKWPAFEKAFAGFDPDEIAAWSPERLEALASEPSIIRNFTKIKSVAENARMICMAGQAHGGYARFIAEWPAQDPVGLWRWLQDHGSRLGGNSGPMYLRSIGKDTFVLSSDVLAALTREGVFEGNPRTRANLARIQAAFIELQAQSGRPLCELSRILSRSVG